MSLVILYEDDDLLFVNKPSGMLVHRGMGRDEVVLVDLVRAYTEDTPRPVHRLDRGTSGVVLFAKSTRVAAAVQEAFSARTVNKSYIALVRGVPPDSGDIDNPVPRSEDGERVPAQTSYERLETVDTLPRKLSLVRAFPLTGRFHQIRRHLKHINHPIIGDANYGKGPLNRAIRDRYGLERLALHAESLAMEHPVGGQFIRVEATLPESLAVPLERMRG